MGDAGDGGEVKTRDEEKEGGTEGQEEGRKFGKTEREGKREKLRARAATRRKRETQVGREGG